MLFLISNSGPTFTVVVVYSPPFCCGHVRHNRNGSALAFRQVSHVFLNNKDLYHRHTFRCALPFMAHQNTRG